MLAGSTLTAIGVDALVAFTAVAIVSGIVLYSLSSAKKICHIEGIKVSHGFFALCMVIWALAKYADGDSKLWYGFSVIAILVVTNIIKMVPSIITAVIIHRLKSEAANYWYRVLFVVPMIIPGMVYLLIWKFFFKPDGVFNIVLIKTKIMALLIKLDAFLGWGGLFNTENINPAWLNDTSLIIPALILWGFPWVGVVGVLIYLAGLQGIDESVYEAADLDGINPLGKFLHIEFPLILTQVRINLVLMIIGTLQMYSFILILFDSGGGPDAVALVPGLHMFAEAFEARYAGYACAIGLIIFIFILILTEINNRFVRVDK